MSGTGSVNCQSIPGRAKGLVPSIMKGGILDSQIRQGSKVGVASAFSMCRTPPRSGGQSLALEGSVSNPRNTGVSWHLRAQDRDLCDEQAVRNVTVRGHKDLLGPTRERMLGEIALARAVEHNSILFARPSGIGGKRSRGQWQEEEEEGDQKESVQEAQSAMAGTEQPEDVDEAGQASEAPSKQLMALLSPTSRVGDRGMYQSIPVTHCQPLMDSAASVGGSASQAPLAAVAQTIKETGGSSSSSSSGPASEG